MIKGIAMQRSNIFPYQGSYSMYDMSVSEWYDDVGSGIRLSVAGRDIVLDKFAWSRFEECPAPNEPYLGLGVERVLSSGPDILAQRIKERGEISPEAIRGILPPITKEAFSYLGAPSAWYGVQVDLYGNIEAQLHRGVQNPKYVFRPSQYDTDLGGITPHQFWLDGTLPILISVHKADDRMLEIMHFIEPGDPGSNPVVWTRLRWLKNADFALINEQYLACGLELDDKRRAIAPEKFWDTFAGTVLHWVRFQEAQAEVTIPDKQLSDVLHGCLNAVSTIFTGDHPHYGHKEYGWEYQDHFPPIHITSVEAYASMGLLSVARRQLEHVLAYIVDDGGRFSYRQGALVWGASAVEYGQFLWLVNRYADQMKPEHWIDEYLGKLKAIGDMLLRNRAASDVYPDLRLIHMCAEADTNGRVYDYTQSSFWVVRGLNALGELLCAKGDEETGAYFRAQAQDLLRDAKEAVSRSRADTRFGPLPPFRIGYTATPYTLSSCRDTFVPISDEEYASYIDIEMANCRETDDRAQDYLENTYANYRYYLDLLSSRYLDEDEERAIVRMRENLGGEVLGMTRFMSWVDDWPAFNYARYLLETDNLDKYLLLMYSHMQYHGIPDLMTFYEQVTIEGSMGTPDCVPSILTVPLMLDWMMVFQPVSQDALYLLRGVPKQWMTDPLSVRGIITHWGPVSLSTHPERDRIIVDVSLPVMPDDVPVYLDLHVDGDWRLESPESGDLVSAGRILLPRGGGNLSVTYARTR